MAFDHDFSGRSRAPVLDPVRVMLIDPDLTRRAGLSRALDLDAEIAVVAATSDVRPASVDVTWASPDLVVIGLSPDDDRCRAIVARLAGSPAAPGVLIIGAALGAGPAAASGGYFRELAERVRRAGLARKRGRAVPAESFARRVPALAGMN